MFNGLNTAHHSVRDKLTTDDILQTGRSG